ncbi:tetratricopeptide repeat protein [Endothiovibrio diazotrophicus]
MATAIDKLFEKAVHSIHAAQLERAEKTLSKILRQDGAHFGALNAMGVVMAQRKRFADATRYFERALRIMPDNHDVMNNLGACYEQAGLYDEAVRVLERMVSLAPDNFGGFANLGNARLGAGEVEGAIEALQRALQINPTHPQAWNSLGSAWNERREWTRAIECFRRAIAIDPRYRDAHYNLSNALFRIGEFAEGFAHYDWRASFTAAATAVPLLEDPRGETGRILVLREQGLGDEIRYVRFLRSVGNTRAKWTATCDARLKTLFARSFPEVTFESPDGGRNLQRWVRAGKFDRVTQIATLGRWYWSDWAQEVGGYLQADPAKVAAWRSRLEAAGGSRRRVAIGWRGVADDPARRHWYMPLATLLSALGGHDLLVVNVQHECTPEEVAALKDSGETLYTPQINLKDDQDELASLLSAVDVVISGTSSLAELAGAIGLPVWVPSAISDEKWDMSITYRKAVYPSMTVFPTDGDAHWRAVAQQIVAALDDLSW